MLLTAPHSMKLTRGGGATGERTRIHKRERYTSEVVLRLGAALHELGIPTAVMVWNRASGHKKRNLDPNYLLASQYGESPWHGALHEWVRQAEGPLFHVDLHGKYSTKRYLDLGTAPLEAVWPRDQQLFVQRLKSQLGEGLGAAITEKKIVTAKRNPMLVEVDPAL